MGRKRCVDRVDGAAKQLSGRVLKLVALRPPPFLKRPVSIDQIPFAPVTCHLKIDVIYHSRFSGPVPIFVGRDQAIDSSLKEMPLRFIEKMLSCGSGGNP